MCTNVFSAGMYSIHQSSCNILIWIYFTKKLYKLFLVVSLHYDCIFISLKAILCMCWGMKLSLCSSLISSIRSLVFYTHSSTLFPESLPFIRLNFYNS